MVVTLYVCVTVDSSDRVTEAVGASLENDDDSELDEVVVNDGEDENVCNSDADMVLPVFVCRWVLVMVVVSVGVRRAVSVEVINNVRDSDLDTVTADDCVRRGRGVTVRDVVFENVTVEVSAAVQLARERDSEGVGFDNVASDVMVNENDCESDVERDGLTSAEGEREVVPSVAVTSEDSDIDRERSTDDDEVFVED